LEGLTGDVSVVQIARGDLLIVRRSHCAVLKTERGRDRERLRERERERERDRERERE
jgi:hypothetical protein